MCRAFLFSRYL
jgi:hypothetical protein